MENKKKILLDLYLTWFKIGIFTFGGGYRMLPLIEKEIVERKKWATSEEILDYYAIGQSTPGIIAINTATFIGYYQANILGGIVSTLGMVSPSLIIITLISSVIKNFQEIEIIAHGLNGIKVGVCFLMIKAIIKFFKSSVNNKYAHITFLIALILSLFTRLQVFILVIISGILGLVFSNIRRAKDE